MKRGVRLAGNKQCVDNTENKTKNQKCQRIAIRLSFCYC